MSRDGPLTRRDFLGAAVAGAAGLVAADARGAASTPPPPGDASRPDVILILVEDASASRFGCYGDPVARTPSVDAFARTALRFDQAHSHPVCAAARTALFLGKRPETTGVFGNGDDWRKRIPEARTLPAHFRAQGYAALRIGRAFFGRDGDWQESAECWDEAMTCGEGLPLPSLPRRKAMGPGVRGAVGASMPGGARERPSGLFLYGPSGLADEQEHDGILASAAVRLLERPRGAARPLFLALGFARPHLPWRAPDAYFEAHPPERMSLPAGVDPGATGRPENPRGEREWRAAIAAHHACLSFVDAQIGRVLAALERSGRAERSVVVVASDHGFLLGEHGLWRKAQFRDEATRSALLIRAPGFGAGGATCEREVELVDLFPTLTALAGLSVPGDLEGTDLTPLITSPQRRWWKKGVHLATPAGRSIVTERFRYTEYRDPGRGPEFFDRRRDPGETMNRVHRAGLQVMLEEHRRLLHGGWRTSLPSGRYRWPATG